MKKCLIYVILEPYILGGGQFLNPAIYLCFFLPLIIVLIPQYQSKKVIQMNIVKKKKKIRSAIMFELIERYIGKECLVYTMNTQLRGTIVGVKEGWLEVNTGTDTDIVNIDYIIRIREYPKKKNGKNKSVILD